MRILNFKLLSLSVLFFVNVIAYADIHPVIRTSPEGLSIRIFDDEAVVFNSSDKKPGFTGGTAFTCNSGEI